MKIGKTRYIPALCLALLLLAGCAGKSGSGATPAPAEATASPAPTEEAASPAPAGETASPAPAGATASPAPAEEAVSPAPAGETVTPAPAQPCSLGFTQEEGPEPGLVYTYWTYGGDDVAEFLSILLPEAEGFPLPVGTMYEGEAALLSGVIQGDAEGGTAELILVTGDGEKETFLTLMYARDRVALLELDADMRSFCRQDEASGLWMVLFTDDGPLGFADAGMLLEGLKEKYALTPVFSSYGLDPAGITDLRQGAAG